MSFFDLFRSRTSILRRQCDERALELELRSLEVAESIAAGWDWDNWVDPRSPLYDDGQLWLGLGGADRRQGKQPEVATNLAELSTIRARARRIATRNEFCINGFTNRQTFILDTGLSYLVEDERLSKLQQRRANDYISFWDEVNAWNDLAEELQWRLDEDGEFFLRFYLEGFDPLTRLPLVVVRTLEPEQVYPPDFAVDRAPWGVVSNGDAWRPQGYFVDEGDGRPTFVDAQWIIHEKLNVRRSTYRGVPTAFPVFDNLDRAEKLLRNMSVVSTVQAAIALIRKHVTPSKSVVEAFADDQKDFERTDQRTGRKRKFTTRLRPGTILDAPKGVDYDMPQAGLRPDRYVPMLAAELRSIAACWVLPEYMLTADASNANMASTLIAESPAVKNFRRLQRKQSRVGVRVKRRALEFASRVSSLVPRPTTSFGHAITVTAPGIEVRNRLQDTQRREVLNHNGVMSRRTWAEEEELDPVQEQERLKDEAPPPASRTATRSLQQKTGRRATGSGDDETDQRGPNQGREPDPNDPRSLNPRVPSK